MLKRLINSVALIFLVLAITALLQNCKNEPDVQQTFELKLTQGLDAEAQYIPENNPLTADKVELGRKLYFDKRLSADNSVSCATCHNPKFGFTDGSAVSTGISGQKGGRSAPTVVNRLFSKEQFWDGRAEDLEAQALGPIQNPIEMGNTIEAVVKKLNAIEGYQKDFQKVFGTEVTADGIAKAIASFERTVISGNAPYDRFRAGDEKSLSESAKRGLELFEGKANCVTCHVGFNFTDEGYRNIGVGMNKENPDLGRFELTSKFYSQADFTSAEFDSLAMLLSPRFGSPIDFRPDKFHAAEFHSLTMFAFAGFDSLANFAFAEFDSLVIFGGAQFDGLANFEGAHFKSYVDFFGAQFDGLANFHGARFRNKVNL